MKDFLNKYKKSLAFILTAAAVLTAAFFIGGHGNNVVNISTASMDNTSKVSELSYQKNHILDTSKENDESSTVYVEKSVVKETAADNGSKNSSDSESCPSEQSSKEQSSKIISTPINNTENVGENGEVQENTSDDTEINRDSEDVNGFEPEMHEKPQTQTEFQTNPKNGNSEEKESSVSENTSTAHSEVESSITENIDNKNCCTFSIICTTAINSSELDDKKRKLLPSDGCITNKSKVYFDNGESVFDVLKRICTDNNIHFEFSITPVTNSAYIEGINNLYEFDCGSLSGWTYSVNDTFPNVGCSEYILSDGDKVEILYTCDLGADVGNYYRGQ